MRLVQRNQEISEEEPRYDPRMMQKVLALAGRLQREHEETMSAAEIESIGAEVGVDPAFIRRALSRISAAQPSRTAVEEQKAEFRSTVAVLAAPLLWGVLAYFCRANPGLKAFFTLIAPAPLAGLLGFFSGKARVGVLAAVEMILSLIPTVAHPEIGLAFLYSILGTPIAAILANWTASMRERSFPFTAPPENVSRPALINLLFALQGQLESQKQHRAFLSVDVVGSSEMKQTGPALAVEHSFGQYRQWVEKAIHAYDGEVHSAAGDGVMGMFSTDAAAVRAARQLHQELAHFNETRNRLPFPFHIRCGISAGEVAIDEGAPLGEIQSPVIDRAAVLQKKAEPGDILVSGEVAGAALTELGRIKPLPHPVQGEPAFSWQAARRALPKHPSENDTG
ncbi:MAG: adenylate/guanylate cyclase domain-containing protein [Armatimonadetes bacterium]|nr:adenylate/guanylate cyclase domain-containing protein [Armatimonadota bacterium]